LNFWKHLCKEKIAEWQLLCPVPGHASFTFLIATVTEKQTMSTIGNENVLKLISRSFPCEYAADIGGRFENHISQSF